MVLVTLSAPDVKDQVQCTVKLAWSMLLVMPLMGVIVCRVILDLAAKIPIHLTYTQKAATPYATAGVLDQRLPSAILASFMHTTSTADAPVRTAGTEMPAR